MSYHSEEWLNAVVTVHKNSVFAVAFSILCDFEEAEDVTQETFIRAWQKSHLLRDPKKLGPWLRRISRNEATSRVRGNRNKFLRSQDSLNDKQEIASSGPAPDKALEASQTSELLQGAISELPEKYRLPIVLYYLEEQNSSSVAKGLGVSLDAVRQQIVRGKKMLKADLEVIFGECLPGKVPTTATIVTIALASAAIPAKSLALMSILTSQWKGVLISSIIVVSSFLIISVLNDKNEIWGQNSAASTGGDTEEGSSLVGGGGGEGSGLDISSSLLDQDSGVSLSSEADRQQTKGLLWDGRFFVKEPLGISATSVQLGLPQGVKELKAEEEVFTLPQEGVTEEIVKVSTAHGMAEFVPKDFAEEPSLPTVQLKNYGRIAGSLLEAQSLEPIVGATVSAFLYYPENVKQDVSEKVFCETCPDGVPLHLYKQLPDSSFRPIGQTTSNESGFYEIVPESAGNLFLVVRLDDSHPYQVPLPRQLTLKPEPGVTTQDYSLIGGEILTGRVISLEDELGVENATIYARLPEYTGRLRSSLETTTDSDGYYTLTGFPYDLVIPWVRVVHPNYEGDQKVSVHPLDGDLNFELQPLRQLVLKAVDAQTGSPIPHYHYRFMFMAYIGYNNEQGVAPGQVNSPDGTKSLQGFMGNDLLVQVAEIGADNTLTGRGGALAFALDQIISEEKVIEVPVSVIPSVTGRVYRSDGTTPVPDVEVKIEPSRNRWHHQAEQSPEPFMVSPTKTDQSGNFHLTNVFPGNHTLHAQVANSSPAKPVTLVVPPGETEIRKDVILDASGSIYGQISYGTEDPLGSVTISASGRIEGSPWEVSRVVLTNGDGFYHFDQLPSGTWDLLISDPRVSESESQGDLYLDDGEERERDFLITKPVQVVVEIINNGKPYDPKGVFLISQAATSRIKMSPLKSGTYVATVVPGSYDLTHGKLTNMFYRNIIQSLAGGAAATIAVESSPEKQYFQVEVDEVDAEVLIETSDEEFVEGIVELAFRHPDGRTLSSVALSKVTTPRTAFESLQSGEYQAIFKANKTSITGRSNWTMISPEEENLLVVLRDEEPWIYIGEWGPEGFGDSVEKAFFPFDISKLMAESPNTLEVMFNWRAGSRGATIERVVLRNSSDEIVSETIQRSWNGTTQIGTIYLVDVPAGMGQLRLEAELNVPPTGRDTRGDVYARIVRSSYE